MTLQFVKMAHWENMSKCVPEYCDTYTHAHKYADIVCLNFWAGAKKKVEFDVFSPFAFTLLSHFGTLHTAKKETNKICPITR